MKLAEKDRQHIWHPYTQEKNSPFNIPIVKGKGLYLYSENGEKYLDAISSWWVNIHGHAHPYIAKKVSAQLKELEHVIFAGFTHPKAVELAGRLLKILPSNQAKIFYSDDGSTSVEVALKMAFQYWYNINANKSGRKEDIKKVKVLALEGAYHGDTFGAMSVSGRGIFTRPFFPFLFEVVHIPFPGKKNEKKSLHFLKSQISALSRNSAEKISSFIFEPLVQGAAGMRTFNAEILDEMLSVCKKNNILTIADEVMTGFGRTGKMFASGHLTEKPDIICLSKGITGGFLPLGVTSCTREIYTAFLDYSSPALRSEMEREKEQEKKKNEPKTFFHGHSYTANPLACAAACASLDLFEKKATWQHIRLIEKMHRQFAGEIKKMSGILEVRTIGTILAIELKTPGGTSYLDEIRDAAYNFFISRKIILRPLGNIIYLMPPYCVSQAELRKIYSVIAEFLKRK